MEEEKWETGSYARKLRDLEMKEDEVSHEEIRLRKYLEGIRKEYNREADIEFNSFLQDFTIPDEGDTEGCLLYAVWAYRAYEFIREGLPKAVMGTSPETY